VAFDRFTISERDQNVLFRSEIGGRGRDELGASGGQQGETQKRPATKPR